MRFNLAASAYTGQNSRPLDVPVTVLIRPSRGVPGNHTYVTDAYALLRMLKRTTELSSLVIDGFMKQLKSASAARLSAVELSDQTLREIGYFVD